MATILLVDDSASVLDLLGSALSDAGHQVTTARGGRSALQKFHERPADVVVTDIYMPEGDGFELLIALSRLQPRPQVFAMSGNRTDSNPLRCARFLGAGEVLWKPFSPDILVRLIAQLCPAEIFASPTL